MAEILLNVKINDAQAKQQVAELTALLKNLNSAQKTAGKETKKSNSELKTGTQNILSMTKGFMQWQIAATLVMKPLEMLRNGYEKLNETLVKTENTVIALKRVLNEDVSNEKIRGALYGLAERQGQTFQNVSEIAENFARSGMNLNDTLTATESALIAMNVAELDASASSDGMIAILSQFSLEASDLTDVIDKLNKTADNFPVTSEKLFKALTRTGSAAVNARLDIDETIGVITALSKSTGRSGENLGTAINSLLQYSAKDSALETYASLSEETQKVVEEYKMGAADMLDVWEAVANVMDNANEKQQEILNGLVQSDEIKNLSAELHDELGDIFETTQDVYGTANTFRKNYFIALLSNIQTAREAAETAAGSAGYSVKENEMALQTYEHRLNAVNAKWEQIMSNEQNFLSFKKGLLDISGALANIVEFMGGIEGIVLPLGTALVVTLFPKIIAGIKAIGAAIGTAQLAAGGWVALIGLVISGIYGAVKAAERARQETIDNFLAQKDNAVALANARAELSTLTEGTKEYYEKEKEIVSLLGDKTSVLSDLTQGTKEYSDALKNLTERELAKSKTDAEIALDNSAAKITGGMFKNSFTGELNGAYVYGQFEEDGTGITQYENYIKAYKQMEELAVKYQKAQREEAENAEALRAEYTWLKELIEKYSADMKEFENVMVSYVNLKMPDYLDWVSQRMKAMGDTTNYTEDQLKGLLIQMIAAGDTALDFTSQKYALYTLALEAGATAREMNNLMMAMALLNGNGSSTVKDRAAQFIANYGQKYSDKKVNDTPPPPASYRSPQNTTNTKNTESAEKKDEPSYSDSSNESVRRFTAKNRINNKYYDRLVTLYNQAMQTGNWEEASIYASEIDRFLKKDKPEGLAEGKSFLENAAEWERNQHPEYDTSQWFDEEGEATLEYKNFLNSLPTGTEQKKAENVFDLISGFKKAWLELDEEEVALQQEQLDNAEILSNTYLQQYSDRENALNSELEMAQVRGASDKEQIAILLKIDAVYKEEYNTLIGMSGKHDEIAENLKKQHNTWTNIASVIEKTYDLLGKKLKLGKELNLGITEQYSLYQAQLSAIDEQIEAISNLEDAEGDQFDLLTKKAQLIKSIEDTYRDYYTGIAEKENNILQTEIDRLNQAKQAESDRVALKEKELAIEKAKIALLDAENDRTTRVYNAEKGIFEYTYNKKAVDSAKTSLEQAEKAYQDQLDQNEINRMQRKIDDTAAYWNSVAETIVSTQKMNGVFGASIEETMKRLGIDFGASDKKMDLSGGRVITQNIDNSDNRTYTFNGVTIGAEQADTMTVTELLRIAPISDSD